MLEGGVCINNPGTEEGQKEKESLYNGTLLSDSVIFY